VRCQSPGFFTEIRPVWAGDLETRPNLKSLFWSVIRTLKKGVGHLDDQIISFVLSF
jgi:hypothetical protein